MNSETITEQPISFKTAKLAKEKGFNEETYDYFNQNGECETSLGKEYFNKGIHTSENIITISCPTQSLLQKWLRKTNKILVEVVAVDDWDHWIYSITTEGIMCPFEQLPWSGIEYLTYEEALEIGLQEALKLIK